MGRSSTFNHLMLVHECKKNGILNNAELKGATSETLQQLVNDKNSFELEIFPLKLGRVVLKKGLKFMGEVFPKIETYIKPDRLRLEPSNDEIEYMKNNKNIFSVKPSLPLIIAKNIFLEMFGSELNEITKQITSEENPAENTDKDFKVPLKNIETKDIEISSKKTYSDVFDLKTPLKRKPEENIDTIIPCKQLKIEEYIQEESEVSKPKEKIEILSDECLNSESQYQIENVELNRSASFHDSNIQFVSISDNNVENCEIHDATTNMEIVDDDINNNLSDKNDECGNIQRLCRKDGIENDEHFDRDDKLNKPSEDLSLSIETTNQTQLESELEKNFEKINSLNSNLSDNFLENFEKLIKPDDVEYDSKLEEVDENEFIESNSYSENEDDYEDDDF